MLFYLKLNKDRAKFIRLFIQGARDMSAFMFVFGITIVGITLALHVLGATFDDGYNFVFDEKLCEKWGYDPDFCQEYNADVDDYQFLAYFWVVIISNIRTAIGDLGPPSYNYWAANYESAIDDSSETFSSIFYITLIWSIWIIGILLNAILALNFLIAIVS